MSPKEKIYKFRITRYDPDRDKKPYFKTYEVPCKEGWTVLDALYYIKENLDSTLAFRASCRMGVCGSCGMVINGKPRLACQTQVKDLGTDTITVKPLPNYLHLRDLVADLEPLLEKHASIKPYIIRDEEFERATHMESIQSPEELEMYLQFSYCIKCGMCLAACPTVASDEEFIGPQALTAAYRYSVDTRDMGLKERLKVLDQTHGVWRCHFAGACTDVCPKGVDPALGVQLLKHLILSKDYLKKKIATLAPPIKEGKRRPGVPEAPKPTV